ncbi:hypothetical protein A3A76_05800 [Candidatus Woesebacteria bacterium RIFCSPLOWO2_01_FULL_39_23]|uniref:RRM domain-containing protein n=1 Tax=Candidatus Woesebacteria bacterium RIFCSPHIGHO2_01_FULL_40_22 TaxID=1802499 RepID=A0A1F7YHT0_9BACT|nr:MAG: hypothetical protein A2141_02495 [Candidatus Woesebacteria bacterium RBG_16_40_11]OGM26914.1 MAG: hypothetical protein A2628_05740 [Candidatus Woesebacteria bacterium RIFCSPHIGHO2_01_FULL_40_22]OGM37324.1 MAG: hypothetical protein A3E41_04140 [Candidatus Woesebacteria bacterium RIFCSPHIGHO2_12_FULL_38_9]OGM63189.1 MAG: hypothetical protein A3A76_05800 [Candidatus Woesebacteria bacterium RIFCSPLOWO2_01_FULL_39_23]
MSKRLFVGGLPYSVTSPQLMDLFSKFGKVISADVISDKYTGQSKGFAFVEMENEKEADEAIKNLNETVIEGSGSDRKIAVNEARPREERPRFENRGGGGSGGPRNNYRRPDRRSRY